MIIVSDTSPLRYLVEIDAIDVLPKMFGTVYTTPTIVEELKFAHFPEAVRTWAASLPAWLIVVSPREALAEAAKIHAGEAEAIALALEKHADRLLIDDDDAKRFAKSLNLRPLGTLAVLAVAAELGHIRLPDAIERLLRTRFRVTRELIDRFLRADAAIRAIVETEASQIGKPLPSQGE